MAPTETAAVPPATFRCNRKRMVLVIRVALHHVGLSQIELHTSRTRIDLKTTGRRKFALCRNYPNGMECDDEATSAKMDGNMLRIEMPILKLPTLVPNSARPDSGPKEGTKRKPEAQPTPSPPAPAKKQKKQAGAKAAGAVGTQQKLVSMMKTGSGDGPKAEVAPVATASTPEGGSNEPLAEAETEIEGPQGKKGKEKKEKQRKKVAAVAEAAAPSAQSARASSSSGRVPAIRGRARAESGTGGSR